MNYTNDIHQFSTCNASMDLTDVVRLI